MLEKHGLYNRPVGNKSEPIVYSEDMYYNVLQSLDCVDQKRHYNPQNDAISRKLDLLLKRDAKTRGISVNALLATLLTKYAEWDWNAERFGFTELTNQTVRGIVLRRVTLAARVNTKNIA